MISDDSKLSFELSMEDKRGAVETDSAFNVLVIGDFGGQKKADRASLGNVVEVDRDNFGDVMRRVAPRASIELPAGAFEITFGDIEAFHPDSLYSQVRLFGQLRDLRTKLKSNSEYEIAARVVRSWVTSSSSAEVVEPPITVNGSNLLDDILSDETRTDKRDSLGAFVSEVLEPHLIRIDEDERAALIGAVDNSGTELMRSIIHSKRFRELEAAWLGLWFLVRRFETDSRHRIFIADVSKEHLLADLRHGELGDSSSLRVISEIEGLGMIAGMFDFELDVDDVAALIRLSRIGAVVGAPFVSRLNGDVSGSSETASRLWSALRESESAEFIGLTPNRVLGRTVYGSATEPIEGFEFEEFDGVPDHELLCWLNPSLFIALVELQGHASSGIVNRINKLPWFSYSFDGDSVSVNCAEFDVRDAELGAMLDAGLMPIVGYRNEDRVVIPRFQSVSARDSRLGGAR